MTREEAINWLINISADIGKTQHRDLWNYEQALAEIKKMLEEEPHWIPCSNRLPEEDYWLGGSRKQFSDNVLVSVLNSADEDAWVDVSHTIDGEWILELPKYCKILAWQPLPEPYKPEEESE